MTVLLGAFVMPARGAPNSRGGSSSGRLAVPFPGREPSVGREAELGEVYWRDEMMQNV